MKLPDEGKRLMEERFGRDRIVALATVDGGMPFVRNVNAYYEDGAFYVVTHALSNKMRQIAANPNVAISGEWFTAQGLAASLGYWGRPENRPIADRLRAAFAEWIENGHNDFEDGNTIILRIELTHGLLLSHGVRYEF